MSAQTDSQPGAPVSMTTATLSIPSLADERGALDLSAALMSVSGVARVDADTASHSLRVEYDSGFLSEGSLRRMVGSIGYPIGGGKGNA